MRRFLPVSLTAALTGGAVIAVIALTGPAAASAGTPVAKAASASTVLHTASVKIDGKKETIVVNAKGRTVYLLTGDSTRHAECTSASCLGVWPAVTATKTAAKGITGKVTIWNHKGRHQLTLAGHPLYLYAGDSKAGQVAGEGIKSFGGTWYAISVKGRAVDVDVASSASTPAPASSSSGW